jgi:hypothetical protein
MVGLTVRAERCTIQNASARTRASGATVERETLEIVRLVGGRAAEHWGAVAWRRCPAD